VAEAAPVAAPLRVALLARPGAAAERLREALAGIGVELVLETDPLQADPQALAAAAPQAVVVVLDPAVEDALERFDPVLSDPALDVLYEEAELAVAREGWDAARWGRHLSAKLLRHGDVLPPGREADPGSGQEDLSELQPGRPPTPAELAERAAPYRFDEAEASRLAAELPSSAVGMFDPVAAEYDQAGAPGPFDEAGFDLAAGFADAAEAAVEAPPAGSASDGPGPEPEPEAEPAPAGAGDPGKAGPDGGSRYRRDLADLERRIAGLSLEDGPGQGAGDPTGPAPAAGGPAQAAQAPAGARGAVMVFAGIGGPDAVRQFLGELPEGFPRPVLVQQRLDGGRHDRLVQQLARVTALPVQLAEAGGQARPGHVYILPAELGVADGADDGLRFAAVDAAGSIEALPAQDSAVLLFSGADPAIVDAAMRQSGRGALVAGQSPEGCYDAEGPGAAQARGAAAGQPAELARRLAARWQA
jgi:chemosensory pili system protein ChpB (putative protein-glutamate methylesterase)